MTDQTVSEFLRRILSSDGTNAIKHLLDNLYYFRDLKTTSTFNEVGVEERVKSLFEIISSSEYDESNREQPSVVKFVSENEIIAELAERLLTEQIGMLNEHLEQLGHARALAEVQKDDAVRDEKRLAAEAAKRAADAATAEK